MTSSCRYLLPHLAGGALVFAMVLGGTAQAQPRPQPQPPQQQQQQQQQRPPAQQPGAQAAPPAAAPAASATVDGFRSAKFGMTEAELRAAIRKDFNTPDAEITKDGSLVERTTTLAIRAKDLLPDTGFGNVTYILGFRTKRLIQVTILWRTAEGESREPLQVLASTLQSHFSAMPFKRELTATNVQLPTGETVLFQGADDKARTVRLTGYGPVPAEPAQGQPKPPLPPAFVRLFYIENPTQPDIFRVQPGQF